MAKVAPILLRVVLKEAGRLGIAPDTLCRGFGFLADDLDRPGLMVTHTEAEAVLRRALAVIANPDLGFQLGSRSNVVARGVLALGLLASDTLGEALRLMLRYPAHAGLLVDVQEQQGGSHHTLTASALPGGHDLEPFLVDELFTGLVRLAGQATGGDYAPVAIELVRQRPREAGAFERHFGDLARFGCARNGLVSEARWLSFQFEGADVKSLRYAEQQMRAGVAASTHSGLELAVERAIRLELPGSRTPAQLAATLNVSERTLRRKLKAEGMNWRDMRDEGRKSRALPLVLNGSMTLRDVATAAGFSDLGSFRRAFKRWTGRTAAEMRGGPV